MQTGIAPPKRSKTYISTSTLILIAFSTAFFPRILDALGAPSVINFAHLAIVPAACGFALFQSRTKDRKQRHITQMLIVGLFILLCVILASAIVNNAGIINALLDFLLLTEPFILLLAIACIPMSIKSTERITTWLIRFGYINLALGLAQYVFYQVLGSNNNPDYVKGVFIGQGAGHVVGASVSLTFGVYYLLNVGTVPLWMRLAVFLGTFWHMLVADAKQVLLVFLVAGVLLLVTKFKDLGEFLKYMAIAVVAGFVLYWCTQNVPAFAAFNTWARPEIYGSDGEATLLKTATFRLVPTYYESPLNWIFGLGPGHTVGRLGGWFLREYSSLLMPLGATTHPASQAIWGAVGASWLGNQSSMFSPLFGWAAIWGDLGYAGLFAYGYIWFIVWRFLCPGDFSKFLVLSVLVFGLIFTQMEEPGYMLFVVTIIGLAWQAHHSRSRQAKMPSAGGFWAAYIGADAATPPATNGAAPRSNFSNWQNFRTNRRN
jgi:hypothetical protein